jgi:hypothetical protein
MKRRLAAVAVLVALSLPAPALAHRGGFTDPTRVPESPIRVFITHLLRTWGVF